MELILASTSPYRRALLERLGLPFIALAPGCNEDVGKQVSASPREIARELARQKAAAIFARHPQAAVIGSDQVLDLDGELLGKAGSADGAVRQLQRLAGRSHQLITAVAVAAPQGWACWECVSVLRMRPLTLDAIRRYVSTDEPWDCAGSYKLECHGITLFEQIMTDDYTAIVGLPLLRLTQFLCDLGFEIP